MKAAFDVPLTVAQEERKKDFLLSTLLWTSKC